MEVLDEMGLLKVKNLYLSYVNDFLTVERFAEFYGLSVSNANQIIELGQETDNFTKKIIVKSTD